MKHPRLDREKLRDAVRRSGTECVFRMLDEAIEMLPLSKLESLAGRYMDPNQFLATGDAPKPKGLLTEIRAFEKASLAGDYFESFNVNGLNSNDLSMGTMAWIAKLDRLMGKCVSRARKGDPKVARSCMEILFRLLDKLDQGEPEIVFFADESGSWQVGVVWEDILPVWFNVLASTSEPEAFAHGVLERISRHQDCRRSELIGIALGIASPAEREFLASLAKM